jgi:hypothetical protein
VCIEIEEIRKLLEQEIQLLPEDFYGTFNYTQTGRNLTHPVTLGILCKILYTFDWVKKVGIDVRLNLGNRQKFQPDIVVYGDDSVRDGVIKLFMDYESPNSSDDRIPDKDVKGYQNWTKGTKCSVPYIVITTLPDELSEHWEPRYISGDKKKEIRGNPFKFWYKYYKNKMCFRNESIYFLNIDGRSVKFINENTVCGNE